MRRAPKATVPAAEPRLGTPEGLRAAWWRENVIKLSRPALADLLGLTPRTIVNYEQMAKVPDQYRLACAALTAKVDFDWSSAKVTGTSTVTF